MRKQNVVTVLAPAKLNLALDVVGLLPNGYHDLDMTMQAITLYERVVLRRSPYLNLRLPGSLVAPNNKNTAIKAALAFFHRKRPSKKIPLFLQLDEDIREEVRLLSLFLALTLLLSPAAQALTPDQFDDTMRRIRAIREVVCQETME